ncbi:cbs domain multi-pass transmembrane [Cyclospora cayetanensis]|uniref:Cbs domain multi-pass transmembrane n=1 Tax=Cyclospora cayetanensis TaxID=88456 RepID=A0A1D3CRQ5_9EIME|nr:cbs domain multi-pass transmembrane [Cyclospora cayetanensis]
MPLSSQLMTPLVRILLVVFAVVAIPVAALLDRLLRPSHAAAFYGRNHLRALIGLHQKGRHRLQREEASADNGTAFGSCTSGEQSSSPWLNRDEVMVIQGALDMASKNIGDFLVPLDEVYQLERSTKLTPNVMMQILRRGHSRIPIYEGDRHNIRGILLVKSLICIDPGAGLTVGDVMDTKAFRSYSRPLFVSPSINPYTLLNAFQESRCHLAFVTPDFLAYGEAWRDERSPPPDANLLGIVTMEDVIEQLLQADIMDEFDRKKETSRFAATRPTGGTLPLGSFGAEVASGEISPDGAQGAFFLAFSLSKELDTFPMGVTGTASAALAESTTRTHLSPLSLKAQADAPPSVHSVVEAATAPCMLDSASASGESAFGYAAVDVEQLAPLVGSPLGDTLSASMRPKGYAEALMQPEHRDKEKHKKKRQPLPGAPDGGYAILPDLP